MVRAGIAASACKPMRALQAPNESGGRNPPDAFVVRRPSCLATCHSALTPAAFHTFMRVVISSFASLSNASGVLDFALAP